MRKGFPMQEGMLGQLPGCIWAHLHRRPSAARLCRAAALLPNYRYRQEAAVQAADNMIWGHATQLSIAR